MRRLPHLLVLTALAGLSLTALALTAPSLAVADTARADTGRADTARAETARTGASSPLVRPLGGTADFSFDSWTSDLRLGLTPEGHSQLTTTETIVARFPEIDQNRGIRRAIPTDYDGHTTDLTIQSVTDESGTPRSFSQETSSDDSGDYRELTIAGDNYVHGAQTYVITFSQTNVTLQPNDATDQEFFWEINGTGWAQPFGSVTAHLTLDPAIAPMFTGEVRCLQGAASSTVVCAEPKVSTDATGTQISAVAHDLAPHEGLAIVVGFAPGTFVPRDTSFTANVFPSIGLAGALAAVIALGLAVVLRTTRWRNASGRPTIIAEYLPPKGVNLLTAAEVTGTSKRVIPSLILSFAVRGNLRLLDADGKKKNQYLIELVHADGLDATELSVLTAFFPGLPPGDTRNLATTDSKLARALQKLIAASRTQVVNDGLRVTPGGAERGWLIALGVVALVFSGGGSLAALSDGIGGLIPFGTLVVGMGAAIAALIAVSSVRPLTPAGAELRDYLAGLRLYIELAEADRLRFLQSPGGAERTAVEEGNRPLQVLKLYERVVPYAELFGLEKEWSAVLGDYYSRSDTEPDWYRGSSAFNALAFGSAIGSLSGASSSAWSGTASSSSSSGFGGGASVGGGGGGGGGGGV
ncbi:DUF2207 domain-containing protein [Glaciibacter psychrotolerans]|uniref:Putative membrane protein YgcG n=1 Tax=Glaciibacter psychrotolerans TaxID=670054 RepID=A0A7Z0EFI3_9MICO|nr:DUF2207 domain-containing protein [Leifsonia psychrotolerans]NYJ19997.1 putative membrane protein YgcG [Leifsonia psychrotolerans]